MNSGRTGRTSRAAQYDTLPVNGLNYDSGSSRQRAKHLRVLAVALAVVAALWAVNGTIGMIEDETWRRGPWRQNLLVFGSSYAIALALA